MKKKKTSLLALSEHCDIWKDWIYDKIKKKLLVVLLTLEVYLSVCILDNWHDPKYFSIEAATGGVL